MGVGLEGQAVLAPGGTTRHASSVTDAPPAAPASSESPDSVVTPSLIALVLANLWPLVGVLFFHWTVFSVVLLFWLENVIVGVFNVGRMWMAGAPDVGGPALKVFLIPFFIVHYGIFTAVHGMFVFALFAGPLGTNTFDPGHMGRMVVESGVVPAAVILAVSHGYSFAVNYLRSGEFRTATLQSLMTQPYTRVVVLHVAILFGGFVIMALGAPAAALALLVALKIGIDATAHLREHGGLPAARSPVLVQAIGPRRKPAGRLSDDR